MKKTYLIIAVFIIAFVGSLSVQAQTDVTATYLANAGFDNSCNYLVSTAASNLATGTTNNQTVTGWSLTASIANTASSTFEYGYAGTLNLSGTLYGFIPSQGYDAATGTGHGALGITSAWASPVTYYQTVTLPAGKYSIQYAAYNSGPTAVNYSRVGWVPTAGTSVISTKTTFPMASWTTEAIKIVVTEATTGKIQVGINSPNTGSATVGRIFFDYVKLISLDLKADLIYLKDSANVMYSNQQAVGTSTTYTDLNTAIANAQVVIDNAGASLQNVLDQEAALKTAIANVNGAILLQTRITTWTTYPYSATSVVSNPSFESDLSIGWTSIGGLGRATNTNIGAFKTGTYYLEKWVASPGTQSNINLSQVLINIPNGVYNVTAAAQALQQTNPITYPGKAYVFANADSVEVFALNNYTVQTTVTNNTLKIGYAVKTTGNWVAVDNFLVSYIGTGPKAVLKSTLDSAKVMVANPVTVGSTTAYPNLSTVIAAAQLVFDNAAATQTEIDNQVTALNNAIAVVHAAILLQTRINTWTTLPYNATSAIVNPSFENSATAGWINVGAFAAQNNTSFAFKAGTYYVEKWQGSGNWTGLKLSQTIKNIPNGIYNLTAGALNNPNTTGGAFVFANAVKAEVFATNDYSVTVAVTNNELEIGYEVVNGGNYVAVDNFRLSYISDGSPYVVLAPTSLLFDPNNLTKTFNVTGGNLTANLALAAPAGISLDKTSLTPAEVAAGAVVTATFNNATVISNGVISATSGTLIQNVTVNTSADLSCFTPLYSTPNLITDPYCNSYLNDGWGAKSINTDPTYVYCGYASGKIDGGSIDRRLDGTNGNTQMLPNTTYRIKAMVYKVSGTIQIGVWGWSAGSADINNLATTSNAWEAIDFTFTTGATLGGNQGIFFNNGTGYIDNWEMYDITLLTGVNNLSNTQHQNVYIQNNKISVDINLEASAKVEFSVFNAQGLLLSNTSSTLASGNNHQVINANLPAGMYLVRIAVNGKSSITKIIK